MRTHARFALLAVLMVTAGCGQSYSPPKVPPRILQGPHGETAYRLPEDKGYVELLNEPAVDARAQTPTALVAYFLQEDGETPLATAPTDVRFEVEIDRQQQTLPMTASGEAGAARFETEEGPYNLAMIRGTLLGQLDGQEFAVNVSDAR